MSMDIEWLNKIFTKKSKLLCFFVCCSNIRFAYFNKNSLANLIGWISKGIINIVFYLATLFKISSLAKNISAIFSSANQLRSISFIWFKPISLTASIAACF